MGNSINTDKYVGIGLRGIIGPSTDANAQAFLAAAGITGATQKTAIDNLVKGLKSDGLWSKMKAVYPFVTDNRNLLSYTEFLAQLSFWTRTSTTVTNNSTTAPNGTLTADTITSNSSVVASLNQLNLANAAGTYTQSCYFKDGYSGWVCLYTNDSTMSNYSAAWFNLTSGTLGSATSVGTFSGASSTITNVGGGWYRCSLTFTKPSTANSSFSITAAFDNSFATNVGGYIFAWGAQLELGALTAYQPIIATPQAYIASQFKYNLKDPRDLDAAFRLVFNGGWTHSSTGATPNGTNGYADTKLNDNTVLNLNDVHSSVYSRTNVDGAFCDLGVSGTVNSGVNTFIRLTNKTYFRLHEEDVNTVTTNDSRGFFLGWRNSSTIKNIAVNGTKTAFTSAVGGKSNGNIYLGALYNIPTVSATSFSPRQLAFSSIGDGLLDAEAAALYSRVQNFQVALSRNV